MDTPARANLDMGWFPDDASPAGSGPASAEGLLGDQKAKRAKTPTVRRAFSEV